jgi:hypothetical protein
MSVVIDGTTGITAAAFDGAVDAADLTGTLPALNGSALTSLSAANLTGTMPALNGSALTSLSAANLTGNVAASRITAALNATGSAPIYACRAWVNFNGTGTVAIRASGNVSSITDNGVGDYTVNFTTALPDANYAISATCTNYLSASSGFGYGFVSGGTSTSGFKTASSMRLRTGYFANSGFQDQDMIDLVFFR